MPRLVYLIDDNPTALEIKRTKLANSGFEVFPFQHPLDMLDELANCPLDNNRPYAVLANNETSGITGANVICFLRPQSVNYSLKPVVDRKVVELYTDVSRRRKIDNLAETGYGGKLVLTSRRDLNQQDMANWMSMKVSEVIERATLNEALRISDRVFHVGEDGSGMDKLIKYLLQ